MLTLHLNLTKSNRSNTPKIGDRNDSNPLNGSNKVESKEPSKKLHKISLICIPVTTNTNKIDCEKISCQLNLHSPKPVKNSALPLSMFNDDLSFIGKSDSNDDNPCLNPIDSFCRNLHRKNIAYIFSCDQIPKTGTKIYGDDSKYKVCSRILVKFLSASSVLVLFLELQKRSEAKDSTARKKAQERVNKAIEMKLLQDKHTKEDSVNFISDWFNRCVKDNVREFDSMSEDSAFRSLCTELTQSNKSQVNNSHSASGISGGKLASRKPSFSSSRAQIMMNKSFSDLNESSNTLNSTFNHSNSALKKSKSSAQVSKASDADLSISQEAVEPQIVECMNNLDVAPPKIDVIDENTAEYSIKSTKKTKNTTDNDTNRSLNNDSSQQQNEPSQPLVVIDDTYVAKILSELCFPDPHNFAQNLTFDPEILHRVFNDVLNRFIAMEKSGYGTIFENILLVYSSKHAELRHEISTFFVFAIAYFFETSNCKSPPFSFIDQLNEHFAAITAQFNTDYLALLVKLVLIPTFGKLCVGLMTDACDSLLTVIPDEVCEYLYTNKYFPDDSMNEAQLPSSPHKSLQNDDCSDECSQPNLDIADNDDEKFELTRRLERLLKNCESLSKDSDEALIKIQAECRSIHDFINSRTSHYTTYQTILDFIEANEQNIRCQVKAYLIIEMSVHHPPDCDYPFFSQCKKNLNDYICESPTAHLISFVKTFLVSLFAVSATRLIYDICDSFFQGIPECLTNLLSPKTKPPSSNSNLLPSPKPKPHQSRRLGKKRKLSDKSTVKPAEQLVIKTIPAEITSPDYKHSLFSPTKKHKTEEFFNIAATPEKCPAMRKMDFASPTKPAPIEETIVLASPPIRCIQSPDFKLFKRRSRPKFSKSCSFYGDQIDERSDCNTQSNTFFEACEAECFGDHNSNSTFSKRLNAIVFDEKNVDNDENNENIMPLCEKSNNDRKKLFRSTSVANISQDCGITRSISENFPTLDQMLSQNSIFRK